MICGAKLEAEGHAAPPEAAPTAGHATAPPTPEAEESGGDWTSQWDSKWPSEGESGQESAPSSSEDEGSSPDSEKESGEAGADWTSTWGSEPEAEAEAKEPEWPSGEEPTAEAAPVTGEGEAEPTAKTGYLIFPDKTEKQIPPSQWLIGRADLTEYLEDRTRAAEISRGHITVFQEGEKFYVEDGRTMVQDKPSENKSWLIREGSRSLLTGKGRSELQNNDEIDIAELVRLQFAAK